MEWKCVKVCKGMKEKEIDQKVLKGHKVQRKLSYHNSYYPLSQKANCSWVHLICQPLIGRFCGHFDLRDSGLTSEVAKWIYFHFLSINVLGDLHKLWMENKTLMM